jgi:Na+/proline symporter
MLLVGGVASIVSSFENISPEYAIILFIIGMAVYVFIGDLGYNAYLNTLHDDII